MSQKEVVALSLRGQLDSPTYDNGMNNSEWYVRYACAARRHAQCECAFEDCEIVAVKLALRVYSDRTHQRQNDGVKHNALEFVELEHMFVNRSIRTGRVASKKVYNRDAVD